MEYGISLAGRITQSCSPDSYRDCSMAVSILLNLAQWLFQSSPMAVSILTPPSPPQPDKSPDG